MIIHSIISPYDIFPFQPGCCKTELCRIKNGFIEIDTDRKIKRVISTNPQDYLNESYQLEKYLP